MRSRNQFLLLIGLAALLGCTSAKPENELVKQTFRFHSTTAKQVAVAASFNNWSAELNPLKKENDSIWTTMVDLTPGYYQYKLVVDGQWLPDPENNWKINDGGDSFNSIIKVGEPPVPKRRYSERPFPKERLPRPVLDDDPQWIEIYYAAWQMAWNKIQQGTPENGFTPFYMDEGFNELIYQWDLCFITRFAIYGRDVFPVMLSLDNFYGKQRTDGYIQRVYWETTGKMANQPSADEPMVNPPLFAWIEWRYYQISGDTTRFRRVLPVLTRYYDWTEKHCRTAKGKGLFYTSPLGSGMDNTPRRDVGKAAWIDYSSQQALAARYIAKIASVLDPPEVEQTFTHKYNEIKTRINRYLWDERRRFYYDLTESDTLSATTHIGAFWTLLADVCPPQRLKDMTRHLRNPGEFWRPHLVPTLAADQPQYDPNGHYWLGSVWPPTNYMLIKGLIRQNQTALADSIVQNHLQQIADVFFNFKPDPDSIAFEQRYDDGYHTLWECYSSEYDQPATRWDNTFYSRQDFVGWTGLGPIALLIENILGFDIRGDLNQITWRVRRSDRHGIENIQLGRQKVSLICKAEGDRLRIEVRCEKPFTLKIDYRGKIHSYEIVNNEENLVVN